MKKFIALIFVLTISIFMSGCASTGGASQTSSIDTNKLAQARTFAEVVGASAVRRVISRSPDHANEIAGYMRAVAGVFCSMSESKSFDSTYLVKAIGQINIPKLDDDLIIDAKNALVAGYSIIYADRFKAEIEPNLYLDQVCQLLCNSIDVGLKDSGMKGVK